MLFTAVIFVLILSVLILVHELGHFLVAKKLGVKVEEFGFGFPPRVYGKKIGETLYSINFLPIGGFVKLYGEDDAGAGRIKLTKDQKPKTKNQSRAFFARPVYQRAAIVVAGVFMNFVLAVVIISYLFTVPGVASAGNHVVIAALNREGPAQSAGLRMGDTILSINNIPVTKPDQVISVTRNNLGKPELLTIQRNHKIMIVSLTPRLHYPPGQGPLGIAIAGNITIKKYPWYEAPFKGTIESLKESWMILQGLGSTVVQLVVTKEVPQGVAGPVGIAQLTGAFIKLGLDPVLSLVGLLSLNLAVLNILPIPALDGGRFFFILIEAITGRKVHSQFETYAHTIGMILLLALVALITLHDIIRLITGQPLLPKM